jgi:hypothetical protein
MSSQNQFHHDYFKQEFRSASHRAGAGNDSTRNSQGKIAKLLASMANTAAD